MDNFTYENLRCYAIQPLAAYFNTAPAQTATNLAGAIGGGIGMLNREHEQAMELWGCRDLTATEKAAAHLLAVISVHRAIAWHREPEPPNGREPAPPLSPEQTAALWAQTREAVRAYAIHLPEREAEWLRAQVTEPIAQPQPQQFNDAQDVRHAIDLNTRKKSALVRELKHEWPSIQADLSESSRNGLNEAAKCSGHGLWHKANARAWAQVNGKLLQPANNEAHHLSEWLGPVTRNRLKG